MQKNCLQLITKTDFHFRNKYYNSVCVKSIVADLATSVSLKTTQAEY